MDKAVLVTGGARGIGLALARGIVAAGGRAAVLDCDGEALARARDESPSEAGYFFREGDVSRPEDCHRFAAETAERFGGIGTLVNNAAVIGSGDWDRVIAVNLTGAWNMCRAAEGFLRESGGSIVNIASTRALMSEPGTEPYSASKGGLLALTHALAVSWGPVIRVNAVSPGWIDTAGTPLSPADHAQHPAGRVGTPEDVVALVLYLLSDKAGFITGQNFVVDGGMTKRMIYV